MTDDTEQPVANSGDQGHNNVPNTAEHDPKKLIQDHARQAIVDAGGNPQLLMPHITSQLGWRRENPKPCGHVT